MRRASLLLLLVVACSSGAPRDIALRTGHRVVLLSFDGLGADELAAHPQRAFTKLQREGTFVERVTTVTPTVTSAAHVAILTGAPPDVNGIVGNKFHKPGTPWTEIADGFTADIDAETLLEAAHRAGKRVGSIAFPTIDGRNERRRADFALQYTDPVVRARIVHLKSADFRIDPAPHRKSFSPAMRADVDWNVPDVANRTVAITAYDGTDDQIRNYDEVLIETESGDIVPDVHGWFAISTSTPDALYGSWSKVQHVGPSLDDVSIYFGSINRSVAYPASFQRLIDERAGFSPGAPDERNAQKSIEGGDGISADTFIEQNARQGEYLATVTRLAIEQMPFDLLLAYEPVIDKAEHQFLITSDAQPYATREVREAGERVRAQAFATADAALERITSVLDPSKDAIVVTGDHGMAPIDVEVHLQSWLAQHGFADWLPVATGGGVAHLYSMRDDAGGATKLKQELLASGLIERVDGKTHPNSGDLVAYAFPHVALNVTPGEPAGPPMQFGQHGGIASHPEFQTLMIAWGAGVDRTTIPALRQTQIARYVSRLLGIDPPRNAE